MVALEGEIHHRAKSRPEIALLLGIPEINVLSAMTILAEIGDIFRFPSAKKLASYAGLVPRVYQSGATRYTGHITKAGRTVLRWILVQTAHRAVQNPGLLRSFYLHLKEKKGAKVAVVAVATSGQFSLERSRTGTYAKTCSGASYAKWNGSPYPTIWLMTWWNA